MEAITRSVLQTHRQFINDHLDELLQSRAEFLEVSAELDAATAELDEHIENLLTVRETIQADLLRDELEKLYAADRIFTDDARPKVTLRFGFDDEPVLQ